MPVERTRQGLMAWWESGGGGWKKCAAGSLRLRLLAGADVASQAATETLLFCSSSNSCSCLRIASLKWTQERCDDTHATAAAAVMEQCDMR